MRNWEVVFDSIMIHHPSEFNSGVRKLDASIGAFQRLEWLAEER